MKQILCLIAILFLGFNIELSANIPHPYNTKFDLGNPGEMPVSWTLTKNSQKRGFELATTDSEVLQGKYSAEISNFQLSDTLPDQEKEGVLKQELDAFAFRGKIVKLSGSIKTQFTAKNTLATMWVNIFEDTAPLLVERASKITPIPGKEGWSRYELEFYVPLEADKISYGAMMVGAGRIWVDDVDFSLQKTNLNDLNKSTKLTPVQMQYLEAFADLFGYMRYYSPQSKISSINYDNLLLHGVNASLKAKNDIDFLAQIYPVSRYMLPGINVAHTKDELLQYNRPSDAMDNVVMSMLHQGLPELEQDDQFASSNVNIMNSQRRAPGMAIQIISLTDFKSGKLELSFDASLESSFAASRGELWVQVNGENGRPLSKYIDKNIKITDKKLKTYSTSIEFPETVQTIRLAFVLNGDGRAVFDNMKTKIITQGTELPFSMHNPSFDMVAPDGKPSMWQVPDVAEKAGYNIFVEENDNNKYLVIQTDESESFAFPNPGETVSLQLLDSLWANIPLCFYSDGYVLLPKFKKPTYNTGRDSNYVYLEEDLNARLAIAINLWNAVRFFDKSETAPKSIQDLKDLLSNVAKVNTKDEFQQTLSNYIYKSKAANSRIWKGEDKLIHYLPFMVEYYNKELIVTKVKETAKNINPGDRITKVNGKAIEELLNDKLQTTNPADNMQNRYGMAWNLISTDTYPTPEIELELKRPNDDVYSTSVNQDMILGELKYFIPERFALLDSSIIYIDACAVEDKELAKMIDPLMQYKGIILDFRGTALISEHFLSFFTTDTIASYHGESFAYYRADRDAKRDTIGGDLLPDEKQFKAKLAILVDESSQSFSEAIVLTAKNGKVGRIFGKKTAGAPYLNDIVNLAGNYYLSMPALNLLFDGKEMKGSIEPEVIVDDNPIYKALDRDIILEEALRYLQAETK